ncbi:MAG TPA: phasin family protein [Ramlibacter sp.]|nr:phasin family protein [Ramlibacter sp.]
MNARRISTPAPSANNTPSPWSLAGDFGRQQWAVLGESSGAMMRGFEAMRKIQEQAGQQAMANNAAALQRLSHAKDPASLLAAQSELLSLAAQSTARYWQDLGAAAMEMQTEVMGSCTHLVDSESLLHATAAMGHLPVAMRGFNGFLESMAGRDAGR